MPLVESRLTVAALIPKVFVSPIPLTAFRSILLATRSPAPLAVPLIVSVVITIVRVTPAVTEDCTSTSSVPSSPLIVILASQAASNVLSWIMSLLVPALIVSNSVGFAKETDAPSVESMNEFPSAPPVSVRSMVSAPPVNVKALLVALRLSVIGSTPV